MARYIRAAIDTSIISGEYEFYHEPVSLKELHRYVKKRAINTGVIFRTSHGNTHYLSQVIDGGYLFQSNTDDVLPVILMTNRQGVERDDIEIVTDLVRYDGLTTYRTVSQPISAL